MHGFAVLRGGRGRCSAVGNQRGSTLIELLVASFIGLLVVGSAFEIYLTQHRNWIIQDQVTDAQQSARAAIRMLSGHIRMAGYGLPTGVDPIYASNADPDTLTLIYQPAGMCEAPLEQAMASPSAELRCDGHDVSCFEVNKLAYIYDPGADTGEYFAVTDVQQATSQILHTTTILSRIYPTGSLVFMVETYRFYVDCSDTLHPTLMIQTLGEAPQPYADNIEDLQFRYILQNGDTVDVPNQPTLVRRVLVAVVARTDKTDLQFEGEYRRRQFATDVQVRNLGL